MPLLSQVRVPLVRVRCFLNLMEELFVLVTQLVTVKHSFLLSLQRCLQLTLDRHFCLLVLHISLLL